jgi:hypothetical protein
MKNIKKTISLILTVFLLISIFTIIPITANAEEEIFTCGDWKYVLKEDGTAEINNYVGSESVITIPSELDNKLVTSIGALGFSGSEITNVNIPSNIKTIDVAAFSGCRKLTTVNIPNSITIINYMTFYQCTSLVNVSIPNSVKKIDHRAFQWCTSLTDITIPDSVTIIGEEAFNNCESLNNINVSENNSFYSSLDGSLYDKDKTKLIQYAIGKSDAEFTVPSTVTSIEPMSFRNSNNLKSIVIPANVTTIAENALGKEDVLLPPLYSAWESRWLPIIIKGYVDSVAQTYAKEHGLTFIDLVSGKTYYYTNESSSNTTIIPSKPEKQTNPIKVTVKTKTIKAKKLKKKAQKVKAITVNNNQGKVTFKLVKSGITKKIRKFVKINSKGVITIKKWKKAKKGTYKIKIKVTAAGNINYNAKAITKTVKVKVK